MLDKARPNDLTFFARPIGAFTNASEITRDDALSALSLNDSNAKIHRCDSEDLALLMTKPDALGPYLEFVDVENLWIDPSEGETVIGLGFPVSSGFIFGKRLGAHIQKDIVLALIGFRGPNMLEIFRPDRRRSNSTGAPLIGIHRNMARVVATNEPSDRFISLSK